MTELLKELIAQIDDRTTVICLDAAGQLVEVNKPFVTLSGIYMSPPFHWNCRSIVSFIAQGMNRSAGQIGPANRELETRYQTQGRERFRKEVRRSTRLAAPGRRPVGIRQQQRRLYSKDPRRPGFFSRRTLRDQELLDRIDEAAQKVNVAMSLHGHTMERFLDRRFGSIKSAFSQFEAGGIAPTLAHDLVRWTPARQRVHARIFDDLLKKSGGVPQERRAVIMGGLPGAGKTTTVGARLNLSEFVNLNADDFKELLLLRGYADEAVQLAYDQGRISLGKAISNIELPGTGLKGLNAAAVLHEESSWLYKEFSRRFIATGSNVVLDVTMGSVGSIATQITALREAGYTIEILFVDVDISTTLQRAIARWDRSGRFVPPSYIEGLTNEVWGSKNRAVFEQMKDQADSWTLFDNNFRPLEIATGP